MQNEQRRKRGRPPRREDEGPIKQGTWRVGKRERFALTLLSRQTNVEESILLEGMISARADAELVAGKLGRHWVELYDPEDGIAKLRLFSLPRYRPSPEEEQIKSFIAAHAPFFYSDDAGELPYGERVVVLWKDIKAYAKKWHKTRSSDVWGVAKEMAAALKKAGASAPRGKWS